MEHTVITPTTEQWDTFVSTQPRAHFLQQAAWGIHKRHFGWNDSRTALVDQTGQIVAGAQLLFRPLSLGFSLAYLPMGPYNTKPDSPSVTQHLWHAVDSCAKQQRAIFLKWEPGIYSPNETPPDFAQLNFIPSTQTIQPPRTILVPIDTDEDTLLGRMNQGTRRKIRQSQKNNIHYFEGTRADLARFNALMQTTGSRNQFGVHEAAYYQLAFDLFVPQGDAVLLMAEHEGDDLAGIMLFAKGTTAWYVYGASSNVKRNLMASYGLHWQAILWAKARGCIYYDLWGIPDEDEATLEAQFQNRSDGLWGVYGSKRGWGGMIVRSLGAWDKVYNPLLYKAYQFALKMRQHR